MNFKAHPWFPRFLLLHLKVEDAGRVMAVYRRMRVPDQVVLVDGELWKLEGHLFGALVADHRLFIFGDQPMIGDALEDGHPTVFWIKVLSESADDLLWDVADFENLMVFDVGFDEVRVG